MIDHRKFVDSYAYTDVHVFTEVRLRRMLGTPLTNVGHLCVHHSPTGYEWGYRGSGCADLALNILEHFFRYDERFEGGRNIPVHLGYCCDRAYRLHQQFKEDFLVDIDLQSANIAGEDIRAWLREKLQTLPPIQSNNDEDTHF